MVEKPAVDDAPSDLIIIGRYVLTPDVFAEIERVQPGTGGEIQLTDALRVQAANGPFHGVLSNIRRYDTGTPLGWLSAVVDIALDDPTIGEDFVAFLRVAAHADPAEHARVVDDEAVLVDVELDGVVGVARSASDGCRDGCSDASPARTSRVSTSTVTTGSSALSPTCSGSRRIGSDLVNGVHARSMS